MPFRHEFKLAGSVTHLVGHPGQPRVPELRGAVEQNTQLGDRPDDAVSGQLPGTVHPQRFWSFRTLQLATLTRRR